MIRSKIEPPAVRDTTLSRERLLNQLSAATQRRVTLIVAEAGYGKTTLLSDYSKRTARCIWYKLDSADADWVTVVNYLVTSLRELDPAFGAETLRVFEELGTEDVARRQAIASLLADLHAIDGEPTTLILDDFHNVDEHPDTIDLVTTLLRDAPSFFRFILSTRRRPQIPLARWSVLGEFSELSTDDLRFSRAEVERLFTDAYGEPLDPEVLEEVDRRTEGWAASLQLLYSSIRGRPASAVRSLARALSGARGPIYDFLAEEVIAQLPADLEDFMLRSALLDRILPDRVAALFTGPSVPSLMLARSWISEADVLGLLSRGSQTSEARHFHPLLREFLLRQLADRMSPSDIREIHERVARLLEADDPLEASRHYIEAGMVDDGMRCLGSSVILMMGSGRWGAAAQLVDRMTPGPSHPALVAIKARRHFEDGNAAAAAKLLAGIEVADQPPSVRAVVRQTKIAMAWRSGDSRALSAALREVGRDPDTPAVLRDIAQIFVDSGSLSPNPAPFPQLARRLEAMATTQAGAGHHFYAAISLHNAAIAWLSSGKILDAIAAAQAALAEFDRVYSPVTERRSTHCVLAACALEMGRAREVDEEIALALEGGQENGDVDAACAFYQVTIGRRDDALRLLVRSERLEREGRSDVGGTMFAGFAKALLQLPDRPNSALRMLESLPTEIPLDLELHLQHLTLLASAQIASGLDDGGITTIENAYRIARERSGQRFEIRLAVLLAVARHDPSLLRVAVADAADLGDAALLELADVLGDCLNLVPEVPPAVRASIAAWPSRWLPVLRRQLDKGNVPTANVAASLLDEFGTVADIGRLRAFDKTYRKRSRSGLGRALARRVSPRLEVRDLGRVTLAIGTRAIALSGIRRKPASLLMYLVTRPKFTATREQVLDDLWPENDPGAGANSLNQSLYFLRREIDPWYEDDVSVDYVRFEAEMLWLDPELTVVSSADFLAEARELMSRTFSATEALALVRTYAGQFSPEFEYDDWAIGWRTRIHTSYLSFVARATQHLADQGELGSAVEMAQRALAIDPTADDIECQLVWLYWRSGARSAALTQYQHLRAVHEADGLEAPELSSLIGDEKRA